MRPVAIVGVTRADGGAEAADPGLFPVRPGAKAISRKPDRTSRKKLRADADMVPIAAT